MATKFITVLNHEHLCSLCSLVTLPTIKMNAVDVQFCNSLFVKVEQCFSLLFKLTTDPLIENHGRAIQKLSKYI